MHHNFTFSQWKNCLIFCNKVLVHKTVYELDGLLTNKSIEIYLPKFKRTLFLT